VKAAKNVAQMYRAMFLLSGFKVYLRMTEIIMKKIIPIMLCVVQELPVTAVRLFLKGKKSSSIMVNKVIMIVEIIVETENAFIFFIC